MANYNAIGVIHRAITTDDGKTYIVPVFIVDGVFNFDTGGQFLYNDFTINNNDFLDLRYPLMCRPGPTGTMVTPLPVSINGVTIEQGGDPPRVYVVSGPNIVIDVKTRGYNWVILAPIFRDLEGKYLIPYFFASGNGVEDPGRIVVTKDFEPGYDDTTDPPTVVPVAFGEAKVTGSDVWYWGRMTTPAAWKEVLRISQIIMEGAEEPNTDPYDEVDGTGDLPGGVSIPIPIQPPQTSTATGILGLFAPSLQEVRDLADFMWTDFGGTGSTVEDILKEVVQALKRSISDPLDYVVGFSLIPSQGLSLGGRYPIRFGFLNSGVSMTRILTQYFTVDCGSIPFNTVCGDTFLDYAPYAKFSVYLPYIGFVDVDANDFVGHTIGVTYRGDVISGALTAYITKDGSVMYQYTGNCAVNIPLSTDSWSDTIHAAVSLVHSVAIPGNLTGAATASTAKQMQKAENGKMSGIDSTAASIASNPSLLSPSVRHSGAVGGPSGAMGVQIPFVLREAVSFHSTKRFNSIAGYPSHYYKKLSDISGYTKVLGIHLEGISATAEEVTEIENLLMSGVIL